MSDLRWLEELLEGHYGFAPTGELRERLSSVWSNPTALPEGSNSRAGRLHQVMESLVISETYFFRERAQIDYLVHNILAKQARDDLGQKRCRILSAGCASGEEVYSLAITLETLGKTFLRGVTITGVDASGAAINKAKKAAYSAWSLRATPDSVREDHFRRRGNEYHLDKRFRERVQFEERNLFEVDGAFWAPGAFDVIFCRNVGIYFSARALRDLVARFAYVLEPGGYLFLGHSENLRGISDDFDLVHDGNVFYYRRKGKIAGKAPSTPPPPIDFAFAAPLPANAQSVEVQVTSTPQHIDADEVIAEKHRNTAIRQRIASLIEAERFDEAWAMLEQLPPHASTTLLVAVVNMAKGLFEETERDCHALISSGQLEADAHCLLGSCREHQRAFDSAARHYREAARLDHQFAIPHLRLGLLLDRSGDTAGGRIELEQAAKQIEFEDFERIALFGGGFSRKVLLELCIERLATRTG